MGNDRISDRLLPQRRHPVEGAGTDVGGGLGNLDHEVGGKVPVTWRRPRDMPKLIGHLSRLSTLPLDYFSLRRLYYLDQLARKMFDDVPISLLGPLEQHQVILAGLSSFGTKSRVK